MWTKPTADLRFGFELQCTSLLSNFHFQFKRNRLCGGFFLPKFLCIILYRNNLVLTRMLDIFTAGFSEKTI